MEKDKTFYVGMLNGNVKDNYVSIGEDPEKIKKNLISAYYQNNEPSSRTEKDLISDDIYITFFEFKNGKDTIVC